MSIDGIAGVAHRPRRAPAGVVLLTHGAGGDRDSPLLIAVCDEWARNGWLAIRYNLPFRRRRPKGPPSGPAADLDGVAHALETAIDLARELAAGGPVIAGGHSYGGRLTSMVVSEDPRVAALTLFSYPLHPPGKPERPRTGHFAGITAPTVFVHGSADPFGGIAELGAAAALIPAPTEIVEITGARHDLGARGPEATGVTDVAAQAVAAALHLGGAAGAGERSGTVGM